jgi:hypothetical protein
MATRFSGFTINLVKSTVDFYLRFGILKIECEASATTPIVLEYTAAVEGGFDPRRGWQNRGLPLVLLVIGVGESQFGNADPSLPES